MANLTPRRVNAASPVFRDSTELVDSVLRSFAFFGVDEAMVDMVVDEGAFSAGDGTLDGLELLRDIDARSLLLDHTDDAAQMTGSAVEPLDDRRVAGVSIMGHALT